MPASTPEPRPARFGWPAGLALGLAFIGLSLLWNLPVDRAGVGWSALASPSIEVAMVFALLALVPGLRDDRAGRWVATAVALATALVATLKLADLALRESLGRPLNPLLDLYLARSLVDLLTDTLGGVLGWLSLGGLAVIPLAVGIGSFALVRAAQRALARPWLRTGTLAASAGLLALFALQATIGYRSLVSDHASRTLLQQWRLGSRILASLDAFDDAIAKDRFRAVPEQKLLARLGGADVLLMFVESYGRSALEQPRYAEVLQPTLAAFERRLEEAGLFAASSWLTSPTVGGQS
jgi:hypothetical protein